MKNYFAIALTCVYLTLSVGVAKTTHYCMGRESSSTLFSFKSKPCPCAVWVQKAKAAKSCCDDEPEVIKIQSEQSQVFSININVADYFEIGQLYSALFITRDNNLSLRSTFTGRKEDPPPVRGPLFKMHCSLVFYESDLIA